MTLPAGTRIGIYEVATPIGAGGMGEVYRARDTSLGREVAVKILPEAFAADAERIARFQREARALAALNHPNIAQIYGVEDGPAANGGNRVRALVMELVEGEDLSARLARGAIPIDEALPMARQIAEALSAAHAQGIVHRDLKPANIRLRPDGIVKVLDFGIAKGREPQAADTDKAADPMASPTRTGPAHVTNAGVIIGTAAYMSPEQAKGRPADNRSDIWGFGVVLYEMLTGRRAFDGDDLTDVLGAVVRLEPDWSALPPGVPQPIQVLLRSCLIKASASRVADISIALFVLEKSTLLAAEGTAVSGPPAPTSAWRQLAIPIAAAAVASALVGATVWNRGLAPEQNVSRLTISPPRAAALTVNGFDPDLAITPDGTRVIYVGNNGTQLFVRALDTLEPVAVFTGSPRAPFVSPDGHWIGFVDNSTVLKKVAVTGGPAIELTVLDGSAPRGGTWGDDDAVIIATGSAESGLQRVAADGTTTVLTTPDRARGEADHLWPERLPAGRAILFTIPAAAGGSDASQIGVLNLDKSALMPVIENNKLVGVLDTENILEFIMVKDAHRKST